MRKISMIFVPILIIAIFISGCSPQATPATQDEDGLTVSVSILPQKYFVERIGGDRVSVNVMVGPGDSPHDYEPKPSQMTSLSESDVYFSIGVEFEDAWMDRISSANSEMLIVDLTQEINLIPMQAHHHHDEADHEDHDHEEEHADEDHADEDSDHAENLDPHIWLSPANGAVMAEKITETLSAIDPDHTATYQNNLDALLADISQLQEETRTALADLDTRLFIVFHPAWGYFAQEFDLQQIPVEVAGNEPSASELAELIGEAQEENISVIFAQPEFSTRSAEYIASELNGKVVLISPLAEDWLENLRAVSKTFAEEL